MNRKERERERSFIIVKAQTPPTLDHLRKWISSILLWRAPHLSPSSHTALYDNLVEFCIHCPCLLLSSNPLKHIIYHSPHHLEAIYSARFNIMCIISDHKWILLFWFLFSASGVKMKIHAVRSLPPNPIQASMLQLQPKELQEKQFIVPATFFLFPVLFMFYHFFKYQFLSYV